MEQPTATYLEDEHVYQWGEFGVEIVLERFREERGELFADVQPRAVGGGGMLPGDKLNVGSARSIKMYANTLASRGLLEAEDWFTILGQACALSKKRYREGDPHVDLSTVKWDAKPRFVVAPYVDQHGTTIIFGDGGVSKSVHALALGLSVVTGIPLLPDSEVTQEPGPVLYLDWEADAETHAERLGALCAGLGIPVPTGLIYMRRSGSLGESVREIRRVIATEGAVFAIVDSIGAAAGGDPEKADPIIRAMNSMRALEVPCLSIHHVTKDSKDKTKPFGSVYSPNLARLTWRVDKEQAEGDSNISVRMTNFKANFGRLEPSRGHGIVFENNDDDRLTTIRFTHVSALALPSTHSKAGQKWELVKALQTLGRGSVSDLAEATDLAKTVVRMQLNRHKDFFHNLQPGTGGGQWILIDTRAEEERISDSNQGESVIHGRIESPPPPIRAGDAPDSGPDGEEEGNGKDQYGFPMKT